MPDKKSLEAMAAEIFELYKLIALARSRQPTNRDELSESEFLTLDFLVTQSPQTVGELQKKIGVVQEKRERREVLLLAVMAINWLILVGESKILKYASPQVND